MAKKNSSKTATEKAIQSSEPRIVSYRGWKGVNFVNAPLTWNPLETGKDKFRQTDLPNNFLMVQNNLITTPTLGIETRDDSQVIGELTDWEITSGRYFTGVAATFYNYLFAVVHQPHPSDNTFYEFIFYRNLNDEDTKQWQMAILVDPDDDSTSLVGAVNYKIKEIGFYENNIICTADNGEHGKVFLAETNIDLTASMPIINIKGMDWTTGESTRANEVVATPYIEDPITDDSLPLYEQDWPFIRAVGMDYSYINDPDDHPDATVRLDVVYCYTNRMGSTLVSNPATIYVEFSPALWSSKMYLEINAREHTSFWEGIYNTGEDVSHPKWGHKMPQYPNIDENIVVGSGIQGIDFYAREMENTNYVFIGHIDVTPSADDPLGYPWRYNWLGNMTDTTQWLNSSLLLPTENTTQGPNVSHFTSHDSRLYYWGQPDKPYRLYIGGNPGAEFSVARGLGGAWVDIEPGSGFEIAGTAKWKTVSGANIVTIMCGNRNTNKVKRFNLVETNVTLTNEVSYKSYMYEEVSNVVGCNSRWGYGVFDDGLYSLSRYGLMLTTMAMEYNSQMKNQDVSSVIKPIFTERLGDRLRDGRLVCIDGVIYIALSEDTETQEPVNLDNVILCYDIGLQAWYTFTHDQVYGHGIGEDPDKIHHIFPVDSDMHTEGLGAVTDTQVRLYPTTDIQEPSVPEFQVIMETGELMAKMPMQAYSYVQQLEFRFDYLIGDPDDPATILIEGVDYYGRQFTIEKKINIKSRGNHGLEGEQRDYVEWIRVEKIVESLRIRIKGKVRFRLTHINARLYTESDRIATPYGFDAYDTYHNRHGGKTKIHHYINDYNNLRRALVS